MSDYFHGSEDDPDELADDVELVVIDRDRHGLPCFGCYFSALFQSFEDHQLEHIEVPAGISDDQADFCRRVGAGSSHVADGMAHIFADAAGADAVAVGQVFVDRFMQAVLLHSAPADGRPN